jgi:hypothetical protein
MEDAVKDEFVIQKILISLRDSGASVEKLSEQTGTPPPKLFRKILQLIREGKVRREKIDGTTPIYVLDEPGVQEVPEGEAKPLKGGEALARA